MKNGRRKAAVTGASSAGLTEFIGEMMRLKSVPRLGWLLRGVRDGESVAAHSYGVALIAMLIVDRARARGLEVDGERVMRMALLHDLTEARTGDLPSTIKRYFPGEMLRAADERAASEITSALGEEGAALYEIWSDYEERRSLEARIVKAADKLDLLFQAREYERGGAQALGEFWSRAETDFSALDIGPLIDDLVAELKEERGLDGVD